MVEFLLSNVGGTIVFLIVLSVLILVHEWGHFITAKKVGIDVEEFSLGFGPKLWSIKKGGTEYMIKAIPLGGYVKMAGDERSKCTGRPHEFYSQPVGKRALVVVNGPLVNVVLAYVCLVAVFIVGYPAASTRIAYVDPQGPAAKVGIIPGDKIIRINGQSVYGWNNLDDQIARTRGKSIEVTFERGGRTMFVTVEPQTTLKADLIGVKRPARDIGIDNLSTVVGSVSPDFPAEKAGIKANDQILRVNDEPVQRWQDVQKAIAESPSQTIRLTWMRGGQVMEAEIVAKLVAAKGKDARGKQVKQIGIAPTQRIDYFTVGWAESLVLAGEKIWDITVLTFRSLYHMVAGDVSAKDSMTGPIGIFYLVKSAANEGLSHVLLIMGMISASLAIFNLFPILPLDGGHLLMYGLEKIKGRPLSPKVEEFIGHVGVGLILFLALYVFYSDFSRFGWIEKLKGLFVSHK